MGATVECKHERSSDVQLGCSPLGRCPDSACSSSVPLRHPSTRLIFTGLHMAFTTPACVYDVPMALNSTLSRTRGMDPRFATARNQQHLQDCAEHLLGPMPPQQFLDCFLPWDARRTRKGKSPSKGAFNSVPSSWETVDETLEYLVSLLSSWQWFLCLTCVASGTQ